MRYILYAIVVILCSLFFSDIVLGQSFDEKTGDMIMNYLLIMAVLRFVAEVGGYIAKKTENKWDNKVIKYLSIGINGASKVAGYFGVGTPVNTKRNAK